MKNMIESTMMSTMDYLYGCDISERFSKLNEEFNELMTAADDFMHNGIMTASDREDIMDELADVNAVLFHIAALMGTTQEELLQKAMIKIKGREKDPNFMRKHPKENHFCGNCNSFIHENADGEGICSVHDKLSGCGSAACAQWSERPTAGEDDHFEQRFTKRD